VFAALREWRLKRAKADGVPAYVVFHDRTLAEIADRAPKSLDELARIAGVGPTKLDRYGREVLAALGGTPPAWLGLSSTKLAAGHAGGNAAISSQPRKES
jgi:ribonuclease D